MPGTTRSTQTSRHCLAANARGADAPFYSGHTPSLPRLKHSWISPRAPDTTPAAADLPALVTVVAHSVTLAQGCYPSRVTRCTFRAPALSQFPDRWSDFRGQEPEAPPYPSALTHCPFGSVSECTDQQALAGLSWFSSSPRAGFARLAEADRPRSVVSPRPNSPRWPRLNEPLGSEPPAGGFSPLQLPRPDELLRVVQDFPRRPVPGRTLTRIG